MSNVKKLKFNFLNKISLWHMTSSDKRLVLTICYITNAGLPFEKSADFLKIQIVWNERNWSVVLVKKNWNFQAH